MWTVQEMKNEMIYYIRAICKDNNYKNGNQIEVEATTKSLEEIE
jgi:hypothetical protein